MESSILDCFENVSFHNLHVRQMREDAVLMYFACGAGVAENFKVILHVPCFSREINKG